MQPTIIRTIEPEDILMLKAAFLTRGIDRDEDYFEQCIEENRYGKRITLLAFYNNNLAGCCQMICESRYMHFKEQQIPEINDLIVFPEFRRNGIATLLMDELERIAAKHHCKVGLGVGLYKDYNTAMHLYVKRGYLPDRQGLMYRNEPVKPGSNVSVDDDLLLYFIFPLTSKAKAEQKI
ncbi:GNAT family N-acetyltransferase [Alteribacter natronophilus]|uniref:GNAT family N-acetyltransferase n=1 Tax=Alteribacter natronophilus TaxID=2583810 RepID=UPI00110D3380|nr:GNAT family N-acetyltransferase [Alteribacter natronophilus]TMW73384.1 GNAT family N-acetyltransferase [Alteribacter natronophilus]